MKPLLVLKARHLSGYAVCTGFSRLEVPEQALDGIPLRLGSVVKINLNFHLVFANHILIWNSLEPAKSRGYNLDLVSLDLILFLAGG